MALTGANWSDTLAIQHRALLDMLLEKRLIDRGEFQARCNHVREVFGERDMLIGADLDLPPQDDYERPDT